MGENLAQRRHRVFFLQAASCDEVHFGGEFIATRIGRHHGGTKPVNSCSQWCCRGYTGLYECWFWYLRKCTEMHYGMHDLSYDCTEKQEKPATNPKWNAILPRLSTASVRERTSTSGNCQSDSCDCNSQEIGNRRRELRLHLPSFSEPTNCTNSSFISRRDARCNSNFIPRCYQNRSFWRFRDRHYYTHCAGIRCTYSNF